jgi:hypothetical protein
MPYIGRSTDGMGVRSRFIYTASADATSISGADANGATLSFSDGAYVDVYLNGILLKAGTDYVTTTANTIGSLAALASNDEVVVIVYDVFTVGDMVSATSGGTFVGNVTFNADITVGDDVILNSDSSVIHFGADSDVTVTHDPDDGLILKSAATADDNPFLLTLQTGETDLAADDVIGKIAFQAPDEGTGTDAILVSGAIQARAEGNHSSSSNATSLDFMTGASEAAARKMSVTSGGTLLMDWSGNVKTKVDGVEGMGNGANLQLHGTIPSIDMFAYSTADAHVSALTFNKSANSTVGTAATVSESDIVGRISWGGYDGVDYTSIAGKIDFQMDGAGIGENDTAGTMVFYTTPDGSGGSGSTERMRIDSTGRTTMQATLNNYSTLWVKNAQASEYPAGIKISYTAMAADDHNQYAIVYSDTGASRFLVHNDGDCQNHDNSFGAISDERIKQNIVDSNSQWDDIKAIKVRNFKRKDDVAQYGDKAWSQIGVVAQEVEAVCPKIIREANPTPEDIKMSAEFGTLYEDGDDIPEGKEVGDVKEIKSKVKSIGYSILYMKAVKALQEAMARIETLETKVKALEDA